MNMEEMQACAARHRSRLLLRCAQDHARGVRYPLDMVYTDPSIHSPGALA